MIPFIAPPVWPDPPPKPGRFAAAILRNTEDLAEDRDAAQAVKKCRVALLGLPDDTGVLMNGGREGARQGPHAFRAALSKYGVATPADQEPAAGAGQESGGGQPAYPHVFDAGDVSPGATLAETHDRVTEATKALLEMGLFPVAIGGGHDLTFPFVRAVAERAGPLNGLYVDAHLDVRPEPGSGMPFRALLESGHAARLRVVGLNPLVNTREHFDYFASKGGTTTAPETVAFPIGPTPPMFVSLDLDALDAAHAPGVSALNPAGLTPREVEPIIYAAGRCPAVRCFDIMELNPHHDLDHRTARLAAHLFLTFLRGLARRA